MSLGLLIGHDLDGQCPGRLEWENGNRHMVIELEFTCMQMYTHNMKENLHTRVSTSK